MSENAIDVERLARRYGRRWALIDVSFQLQSGQVLMITGPNGSGKSTLLRLLATAMRPDAGGGRLLGFDLVRHREDVRRSTALLAHASYLYESLTARENLAVVAAHLGTPSSAITPLLERVGLAERAGDAVGTFSAGMRKRLSLARLLLLDRPVVLLDEPYAQLDPAGFELVDDVIRSLRGRGSTVVLTTHQLTRSAALSDMAMTLEGGRVQSIHSAGDLRQQSLRFDGEAH